MVAMRTLVQEQRPGASGSIPVVSDAVAAEFEAADKWLRPMRP